MAQTDVIKTKWPQRIVIGYAFLLVLGLIFFRANAGPVPIFNLRFNAYALISLTALLANLTIATIVLARRKEFKSAEATWYFLFLGAIIIFSAVEMLQRLSATPGGAVFWAQLGGIGPAFEPIGFFLFALLYVSRRARNVALIPIVILSGGVLFYFFGNSGLIFQTTSSAIKLYRWGYNNDIGKAFILNALWALGLSSIALGILLRFHHRTQNQILKRQSMLFVIAFLFPLVGALIFDIVGPAIGLSVPPLHDVFTVITAALLLYGLRHYKVFDITPASLASDILSTMSESVVVTDLHLKIGLMNEAAEKAFGKNFSQVSGITLIDLFGPRQAQHITEAIKKITNANQHYTIGNYEIENQQKVANVRITAVKITEEHGVPGYVFVIADVTELQRSYDALEREKASVDHKVETRTRELRQAQERLSETDKIKTEFVVLTSHNLRTPLTSIKGNLEFLTDSRLDSKQKKFVTALQASTKLLGDLVEELLTISRIEAGDKIETQKVSLKDVLKPLIQEAESLATSSHNKFSFEVPTETVYLNVNSARFQTALHNLVDNAFKFTKEGEVKVQVTANDKQVVMAITDNGIGITADEVPKLFQKFHRSSNQDNNSLQFDYTGEGIGLYLAKLIIEEHGGSINVLSEPGHGSTFKVTMPRHKN